MRVLIFGAGASYGSEQSARVPPLGGKLYAELAVFAPATWGALSSSWATRFRTDFELAMYDFVTTGGFGGPLQWDMAEFFFRTFSATPSSAYVTLLSKLGAHARGCLFVTLNYESMLFQARDLAGMPIEDLQVCLPHGNAILLSEGVSAAAGAVSFAYGLATSGTVRPFRSWAEFMSQKTANALPPVMSYFEPNKFTVTGENFIRAQRDCLMRAVASADRVAIIGVRVHTIDSHIWDPLARTKATLMYASGSSAASSFRNWSAGVGRLGDLALEQYFREAIPDVVRFLS